MNIGTVMKKNSCSRMGIFKGLKGDLIKMVAGAGFEPTTFGLRSPKFYTIIQSADAYSPNICESFN